MRIVLYVRARSHFFPIFHWVSAALFNGDRLFHLFIWLLFPFRLRSFSHMSKMRKSRDKSYLFHWQNEQMQARKKKSQKKNERCEEKRKKNYDARRHNVETTFESVPLYTCFILSGVHMQFSVYFNYALRIEIESKWYCIRFTRYILMNVFDALSSFTAHLLLFLLLLLLVVVFCSQFHRSSKCIFLTLVLMARKERKKATLTPLKTTATDDDEHDATDERAGKKHKSKLSSNDGSTTL